jgi:hypothetical protein
MNTIETRTHILLPVKITVSNGTEAITNQRPELTSEELLLVQVKVRWDSTGGGREGGC